MSRIIWAPAAQVDLARIDDSNARHGVDFAEHVARAAIAAGRFLAQSPEAGPIVQGDDRKWRVRGTDYIPVDRATAQGVEILRVYHGSENWRRAP